MTPAFQTVGEVAAVDAGPAFKSAHFGGPDEGIRLLRGDNIEPGTLRWARTKTWPESMLPGYEHLAIQEGDLILGMDRPLISSGLKLARARPSDLPALLVQRVARIRPHSINGAYLYYWLGSSEFQQHLKGSATGTQLPHVNLKSIKEFKVPRFGEAAEARTVDVLEDHISRLDAGVDYLDAARRRADSYRRSARQFMLDSYEGDPAKLADLVEFVEAGKSLGSSAPPAGPDEWGIIKVSAMTWGQFRPGENKMIPAEKADSRYEIKSGDLLVSRANTSAYVGASVLVGETRPRLLLSDKSLRITPKEGVEAAWLQQVLQTPRSRQQLSDLSTGTKESMRNISQKALLSISVPRLTPEQQTEMVARCRSVSDQAAALERSVSVGLRRAKNLRRSLLAAAFSGRLTGAASDVERVEEIAADIVEAEAPEGVLV